MPRARNRQPENKHQVSRMQRAHNELDKVMEPEPENKETPPYFPPDPPFVPMKPEPPKASPPPPPPKPYQSPPRHKFKRRTSK